ncbi:hypothetical protein PFISCL1PPCAC_14785, partial [Pristionchus fissidentatus]
QMVLRRIFTISSLLFLSSAFENPCTTNPAGFGKCTNTLEDATCASIFVVKGDGSPSDTCFDSTQANSNAAPLCLKTCQMCCKAPQYDCDDEPIVALGCPGDEADCTQFSDINFDHCKSSCGWCGLDAKPCADYLDTPTCQKMLDNNLCNDEVKPQCEKTCGVCVPKDCEDSSTRCSVWKANGFCNNPFYAGDPVAKYCKNTCNLC